MSMPVMAFTSKSQGLANVLVTPVGIIDPINTRFINKKPNIQQNFQAIWDTGATASVITTNVVNALGLKPTGSRIVNTAGGSVPANTYLVDIALPNHVVIEDLIVTELTITGADVLIGMDIISQGDFTITNYQAKTTFTFRIPSQRECDYVQETKTPATSNKVGRNAKCPCGSGKKYKVCCG